MLSSLQISSPQHPSHTSRDSRQSAQAALVAERHSIQRLVLGKQMEAAQPALPGFLTTAGD